MNRKSTYELDPEVKRSLSMWRVELRHRGLKATEKCIIEALVRAANVDKVANLLSDAGAVPANNGGADAG